MRKLLYLISAVILIFQITAFSQEDKKALDFEPVGGGKYIYCNNREELTAADLADSGENPAYLMSNRDLDADNYRMYVTHFARIPKSMGEELYPGENIWFDAVFTAKTDCEILLKNTAFEVPENRADYLNYELIRSEESWSALYACADLLGKPIHLLHSDRVFEAEEEAEEIITLKAGERVFLSDYIENYAPVPYPKHVMLAADFSVKSGLVDLDIFAARNRVDNGGAEYPDLDFETCGFGVYKRDRTIKGVAQSLPEMSVALEYTIDDTKKDGSKLGVQIKNQYYPKGHGVTEWLTNLNPQSDASQRILTAEESILPLEYYDPSKKEYYGANIPEEERSDVWYFDTTHSDTAEYFEGIPVDSAEDYRPNYVISSEKDDTEYACSLGNYGVTLRYNLTVTNNGTKDRYFDYVVSTAANVVVEVTDENGKDIQPVIARGQTNIIEEKTLASVPLPAGKTTKFSIGMTLSVQNYGGQRQAFKISDKKTKLDFKFRYDHEKDFVSAVFAEDSKENYEKLLKNADEKTQQIFADNLENWKIVSFNNNYAAYYTAIEGNAYLYGYYWGVTDRVLVLDSDFNVIKELKLGSQPIEISTAQNKLYVKTIANGSFEIDDSLEPKAYAGYTLPRENGTGTVLLAKDNRLNVSFDGEEYFKIAFEGEAPPFAEAVDGGFYCGFEDTVGVSADGVYWEYEKISKVFSEMQLKAMLKKMEEEPVKLLLNGELMSFSRPPVVKQDTIFLPIRFIFEQLNMQVMYNAEKKEIIAINSTEFIRLGIGSNIAEIKGKETELSASVQIIDGSAVAPMDILDAIGFDVNIDDKWIEATGSVGDRLNDLDILGDISIEVNK